MTDQIVSMRVYEFVALVAALVFAAVLLVWVFVIRPRQNSIRDLRTQLASLQHTKELEAADCQYKLATMTDSAARLESALRSAQQQLQTEHLNAQQLSRQNAAAIEKLTQLDQIRDSQQKLQQQVVELSQLNAKLEADLQSERTQLRLQAEFLEGAKIELKKEFELTANKLFERKSEQFSQTSQSLLEGTLSPFRDQISDFRKKVEDVYEKENAERNRLSGQIVELQRQAHKIGEDAVNLAQALKGNNKSQGGWGEVILERLLEQSGLQKGREYDSQFHAKDVDGVRRIPDVVIHLPEGKDIVIDAKVSLTNYEKYCNAQSGEEQQRYLQAHINSIRGHIKGLSAKDYEELPGVQGLDFVFIFIPVEGAFMLALQHDETLYSDAYRKHIVLASPTTLLAMLRTIENLWRHDKQNRNAELIAKEAGALHDQFVLLLEALDSVGDSIERTQKAYTLVRKRLNSGRGNLLKRVDGIRQLGAKTKKCLPQAFAQQVSDSKEEGVVDE
ncbi:DNA recombination protein RmuC [Gilvimarinus sp. SDUM040013]|uniref:DNA recombination protein RmuC n=1 Tax=Gilvimarinus gilvus TaxID=3058038 RepID=A0ABU4S2U5_9GAMM|nr:DNA recombination protein RmuC [Gilvimarinus sp. SDUM040013]MDO3384983.1 DNA recombination protein RmuC [Gilvimarinus sp. SDUM040013]MDX6851504.1 DNA recombination protein RmuC [Gilvimarinus sp. SDUM040013]